MSEAKKIAARVHLQRLASGSLDITSMEAVVKWLRSSPNCPRTIRELGDLIAHPENRNKGPIKDKLEHCYFALVYRFVVNPEYGPDPQISLDAGFVENLIISTANIMNPSIVRSELGMSLNDARSIAIGACKKINFIQRDYYHVHRNYRKNEERILNYFTKAIDANPFFDSISIINDFKTACLNSGIWNNDFGINEVCKYLMILAIILLHGASFEFDGSYVATTYFSIDPAFKMDVYGSLKIPQFTKHDFRMNVLSTDFDAREWCCPEVFMSNQADLDKHSLELNSDRKLQFLS